MEDFPCGKERPVKVATPESKHNLKILTEDVQSGSLFGFAQVDIEVPLDLYQRFSEMFFYGKMIEDVVRHVNTIL